MSGSARTIVRLDVLEQADIDRAADAVLVFLTSNGVIGGQAIDGGWEPGPAYREVLAEGVLEWYAERHTGLHMDRVRNDVVLYREWRGFFATSAFEPPGCPQCGALFDEDEYYRDHDDWWQRREPILHCDGCGANNLQGDWVGDRANAFGAPAVEFNNWEELRPGFVSELREAMGGRTAYIFSLF
jgi:hypothetical protein